VSEQAVAVAQPQKPVIPVDTMKQPESLLQRKCACGGSAGLSGACKECQKERLVVQSYSRDRTSLPKLVSRFNQFSTAPFPPTRTSGGNGRSVQMFDLLETTATLGDSSNFHGRLAGPKAETKASSAKAKADSQSTRLNQPPPQSRQGTIDEGFDAGPARAAVATEPINEAGIEVGAQAVIRARGVAGLIAEDDASELTEGQMHKSDFLTQVQFAIAAAADAELAAVGRSSAGCPYIERWMAYYGARSGKHAERALRRYVPEAAGIANARDYIPLVAERVRRAVAVWATTGRITGVPAELRAELPSMGLASVLGVLSSGKLGALTGLIGGLETTFGGMSRLLLKSRESGASAPEMDPGQIKQQLQGGQSLDGGVKNRMENAFGHDFSRVRVHTTERAAQLASHVNARAFTIGNDIAFGASEYQPGTLVGDVLIAHELAHVVQQSLGGSEPAAIGEGAATSDALEQDADLSAISAVASIWGATKGSLTKISRASMPRLRSGLSMRRCPASTPSPRTSTTAPPTAPSAPTVAAACPPALENPRWDVANQARVFPSQGGCAFRLIAGIRPSGSPFGPDGMEFNATIKPTPNCNGRVYFAQYVKVNRSQVGCVDSRALGLCSTTQWGIDTAWPYQTATNYPTDADRLIKTADSPGITNISNPSLGWVRLCLNDEFVTYIVYDDGRNNFASLGWMHWMVNAQAWRDRGTCPLTSTANDCTGWSVAGGGQKVSESFVAGSQGPVPLDRNAPIITAAAFDVTDCEGTVCPVRSS